MLSASEEDSLGRQLDRLLGRRDAACDCRPGLSAGPGEKGLPSKPWWQILIELFVAFLGGVGAFVTACTPLLLGLLKIRADQQKATSKSSDSQKAELDLPHRWVWAIIVAGGLFFGLLIYSFAIALLVFICAFMLCSSVLIVALAHAYKTVDASMLEREKFERGSRPTDDHQERTDQTPASDLGAGVDRDTTIDDGPKAE